MRAIIADMHWSDYELIDFGAGRKLERFGEGLFDRPCPAASDTRPATADWQADARYTGAKVADGKWRPPQPASDASADARSIVVPLPKERAFRLTIDLSPAGQVGLFPEQFANWRWIAEQVARRPRVATPNAAPPQQEERRIRLLNLFAYTGGSTLAAAVGGAEVTHVDASKPSVILARQNAELSGLADAPVRWIVEDALKYCRREVKRGARYDAVVLDPPSYGHGPKGEEWKLTRDLPTLLELIAELTERAPIFLLASCHTPGVGAAELSAYLSDAIVGHCGQPPTSGRLWLKAGDSRKLESGIYARWPR